MTVVVAILVIGVAAIILAGSMTGWWLVAVRCVLGEPMYPYQPRRPVPWGLLDLALIVFATFALMVLAYEFVRGLLGIGATPPDEMEPRLLATLMVCNSAASLALLAAACTYLWWRVRAGLRDLGVDARRIVADVGLGLIAFFILVVPVYLIQLHMTWIFPEQDKHPLITMLETNADPPLVLAAVFVAVVVAPVVEEMFFRVILQGWLENAANHRGRLHELFVGVPAEPETDPAGGPPTRSADESAAEWAEVVTNESAVARQSTGQIIGLGAGVGTAPDEPANPYLSPQPDAADTHASNDSGTPSMKPRRWPIFVSAAVFSAMHLGHGYDFVPLFVLAVGLGYLYRQTHRVTPCIVVHVLLNAGSLALLCLSLTYGQN